jgi:predicted ATPase/DNA-binding XRE family transcriptional regulator
VERRDDTANSSFASLLLDLRRAAGPTQEALAERAGLSARAIQHLEAGETRPYRATVRGLARGLALSGVALRRFEAAAPPQTRSRRAAPAARAPAPGATNEVPAGTLPAPLTSFVARERELRALRDALVRARLLTLVGTGGCGKTRLALELATRAADRFSGGAWFVDLAPLTAAAHAPAAVAAALGVMPHPREDLLATLTAALRSRRLLLVLDNCEHLAAACAVMAETLLRACPGLVVLATSREPLGAGGETIWRVPPLQLPAAGHAIGGAVQALARGEAVRLFAERAAAVRQGFAITSENASAVARICRLLDGLPLAIELAAARARALTAHEILHHLEHAVDARGGRFPLLSGGSRTAAPRHQTLAAAIDWSFGLLTAQDREAFTRLAVLSGTWTLDAAAALLSDRDDERDGGTHTAPDAYSALALLTRLVDKSLVVAEDGIGPSPAATRYRLLETLREYARDKLVEADGLDGARERHAAHFLWWVETQRPAARRLHGFRADEAEYPNLRAALEWLLERAARGSPNAADAAERASRLLVALRGFWLNSALSHDGRQWFETLLAPPAAAALSDRSRATLLAEVGHIALLQDDLPAARAFVEQSLALSRATGSAQQAAECLWLLGRITEDPAERLRFLEEGLALCESARAGPFVGRLFLGFELRHADPARARALLEAALADARALPSHDAEAVTLARLAALATDRDDFDTAMAYIDQSLAISRPMNALGTAADTLVFLGELHLKQGDAARARAALSESLALARRVERRATATDALRLLAACSRHARTRAQAGRQARAHSAQKGNSGGHEVLGTP